MRNITVKSSVFQRFMARVSTQSQSYVELCQRSSVGKRLPDALYVHRSALGYLDAALQELEQLARKVTR